MFRMVTFRLTARMKKILLILLKTSQHHRTPDDKPVTLRFLVREIEGEEPFYSDGRLVDKSVEVSYGRTLKRLVDEGYIDRGTIRIAYPPGREFVYSLTENGEEKAKQIKVEIKKYIDEWNPYIRPLGSGG